MLNLTPYKPYGIHALGNFRKSRRSKIVIAKPMMICFRFPFLNPQCAHVTVKALVNNSNVLIAGIPHVLMTASGPSKSLGLGLVSNGQNPENSAKGTDA